jgi:PBSX family phage terminase large subunit
MIDLRLSEKQKLTLSDSDARINIWEGAVRSGKSFSSLLRWLKFIQEAPEGNLIAVGRTATTIKYNIVEPILELVGADAKYYIGKREMTLWGRQINLIGAADERAERVIRGSTYSGAYIDEATLIPESFWVMLLSRLSREGAKLFATTNPDCPFHWLKKNYIDRSKDLDLKLWKFKLDDNPSLSEDFKENIKREYQGLWHARYIEGQWCLAEGTVYDFFSEEINCVDDIYNIANYYIVGVDYGTTNPTAFTLIGYNPLVYPNIWVEKEYYYDSIKHHRQKTDTEFAADLKKFIINKNVKGIYIDPSAESFKVECNRHHIRNIQDAKNDVLDGIRFVSSLLANGTLKIVKRCRNLINEFQSYIWDSKSINQGVDKPLKSNDHCLDALRYGIFTHFGSNLGEENRLTKEKLSEMKRKFFNGEN